ncbi:hypothetical protein [Pseudomonas sp. BN411]|uniref:hypothetical protein n=1 Tax=Pseudomonas sp. BN411 TaxID=2567887 RepID=UPI002453C96D|nr:hypothetical protein [Pseudomonas sp. BN411]MDH4564247.1 hypothetical protein [Pseudomonas sp. BN411]
MALLKYGAPDVEQLANQHIAILLAKTVDSELPRQVSAEGLSQLVGLLLHDIASNERPLISGLRSMNRSHFQILRQMRTGLSLAILADLPASLLPPNLRRLRAQIDFGV